MFPAAVKKRILTEEEITQLNAKYKSLSISERIAQLYKDLM